MPGPAALFSREWKVLIANPAFAKFQNKSMESLIGADIRSCLPLELMEKYNHFAQEAIRKKTAMHFENEINGTTLLTTCYPVLGSDGEVNELGILTFDISDRKRLENALQTLTKKIVLLNTVIFSDIQNKVYVQIGYLELARQMATDSRQRDYLMKEEVIVGEIQASLRFARQYNDLGRSPPRWQNIPDVMLYAVSHIDLGSIKRDFRMEGLEIYADSLLERVFVTLVENTILNAKGATIVRAWYTTEGDDAVIFVEDDGPGIPEDRKEEIFKKGIATGGSGNLFLSREILSITGIMIRENGISGKGARFEIRVPKGLYRFSGK
jgi:signal transduction histidine kinase